MFRRIRTGSGRYSRIITYLTIGILAAGLTLLLLVSDTYSFTPYRILFIENAGRIERTMRYFDVDYNGRSELFVFTNYSTKQVVEYYDEEESFRDVIKLPGDFLNHMPSYLFADIDEDSIAEIYLFSLEESKILLNAYELGTRPEHIVSDYIIDSLIVGKENNLAFVRVEVSDLDSDGAPEIVFAIRAGYSLYPRKVYSFEPASLELKATPYSASAINSCNIYEWADGDKVVVCGTSAFQNFETYDSIMFNDNTGWLIVYDKDLSDTLLVKEYPDNKAYVQPVLHKSGDSLHFIVHVVTMYDNMLHMERLDHKGAREKQISTTSGTFGYYFLNSLVNIPGKFVLWKSDTLFIYEENLNCQQVIPKAGRILLPYRGVDNSFFETLGGLIFYKNKHLVIRDLDFRILARGKIPDFNPGNSYFPSFIDVRDDNNLMLSLSDKGNTFVFRVKKNSLYPFRFLIIIVVYAAFYFVFLGIFILQNYYYHRRSRVQSKIRELELRSMQSRLQPHFTFNVLSAIGSLIYKEEKEKAYQYLNHFSDMLRSTLLSADQADWTLREELDFISTYIEMENMRFDNRFQYNLHIEKGVNVQAFLPKLMTQTYVENAIKHGLVNKEEGDCKLDIYIENEERHICVRIVDNGIGRRAAAKLRSSRHGLGSDIIREYLKIYNASNTDKFIITYEDMVNDAGKASGTSVCIEIPAAYRMQRS